MSECRLTTTSFSLYKDVASWSACRGLRSTDSFVTHHATLQDRFYTSQRDSLSIVPVRFIISDLSDPH